MSLRYLFGPVTPDFAGQYLDGPRRAGDCLAFDAAGATDLAVAPADTWDDVCCRLPPGWRPDFVALYLPYTSVPAGLWSAPVPLVGLAADWSLLWHHYRRCLRRCDLVLTDTGGAEALAREGIPHARAANLFGLGRDFLHAGWPDGPRDIDILFVGNFHPAVQRERLAWLGRLAALGRGFWVELHTGVFGDDYRRLLARARVVFNRSIRGECNKRAFEAAAAGALLFQEADNREVPDYFRDGQECVCYTADNLEERLTYYLEHEDERRAIAEAARARVARCGFGVLWEEQLAGIEAEWPALVERARRRPTFEPAEDLAARTWQALGSTVGIDPALVPDLAAAVAREPSAAALHNALGLAVARVGQGAGPVTTAQAAEAVGHFRRAVQCDAGLFVAGLNLAEALIGVDRPAEAVEAARQALAGLDRSPTLPAVCREAGHFPPAFDLFRVEWERAAWAHAGDPTGESRAKAALRRWRLHALLSDLTGELRHYYEAVLARPDLPSTRAALGCALGRAGQVAEALPHLRFAVAQDPFDRGAARALGHVLGQAGDADGFRRLARDRRLLARAAPQVVPAEPWFTEAPPVGDELASLIILCCDQLEYTRQCLESVLRHTRAPYELVLVDNGSTDGTAAYLEALRSQPGPARVEVIRHEGNVGFPAGCNQGLARARGDYLVLLNNDTVVTPGWLEGLVGWALHDWPTVGLVGAVTNASRPPQQVVADYPDLGGLDAFAARRRREFVGQAQETERLTGFCLLLRRAVFERIGGFDERFGLGFFDDDDLSVRARQAGFRLLVAQDVFVHHFGSRTFAGLGIDGAQQLRENFERFRDKWGEEQAAGYGLPVGQAASLPAPEGKLAACPRARVSLCLIVKDEEANLADCLRGAADLVDELIVVDTGSTDRTKEIGAGFGARVFDFPWCDSFAAARNETLRHATGEWVFWLDADDRLDEDNRHKLRALFAGLGEENAAYALKCLCLPDPVTQASTVVDHVRLFRNRPDVRWQYRVHEQILPAVRRSGGEVRWSDVVIQHAGYQEPALRRRKLDRDLRLLHLEDAEHPDDPFTLFNLGSVYQELGRPAEALAVLRRSLGRSHPADSIVRKLYALVVQCHRQLGQRPEALAACQAGREFYPEDAELLFSEGMLRRELGDAPGAEACLLRLLGTREAEHFASLDAGLRGYKARHNLAVLYQEQGRWAEAACRWQEALAERPDHIPAWVGLAECAVAARDWAALDEAVWRLEALPDGETEAAVLRARGHLARREFDRAQEVLRPAIARHPEALWPRVILSHALLQEGRDPGAAERALRDVLALDPTHAEARRNLAVLRRRLAGAACA
jgi:GT2 family glycosyltransferase/tetratricopeptide (TPR) repeat protein